MKHVPDTLTRCIATVAALNADLQWRLTDEQQRNYARVITSYIPDSCSDSQLERIAIAYHADHEQVAALRDPQHPKHHEKWQEWQRDVVRIIRHHGFAQPDGTLASLEELTQEALTALSQSLASFGFRSRLSTWAYTTVGRNAQRYLKMLAAAKRTAAIESLDDERGAAVRLIDSSRVESGAELQALQAIIHGVLAEQGNERLAMIFRLWAQEDLRLADIGQRVGLSPGRVSVLIEQARNMLHQHPELRAWMTDNHKEEPPTEENEIPK